MTAPSSAKRRPRTSTNRACLACRELATQLSLDRQFTRRGCAPFDRNGGPAGAGATGVQPYFGAHVAYLALYAAGYFSCAQLCGTQRPQDRVGALVTRQHRASAVVHVDGQAPGLKHAQLC